MPRWPACATGQPACATMASMSHSSQMSHSGMCSSGQHEPRRPAGATVSVRRLEGTRASSTAPMFLLEASELKFPFSYLKPRDSKSLPTESPTSNCCRKYQTLSPGKHLYWLPGAHGKVLNSLLALQAQSHPAACCGSSIHLRQAVIWIPGHHLHPEHSSGQSVLLKNLKCQELLSF